MYMLVYIDGGEKACVYAYVETHVWTGNVTVCAEPTEKATD